jgi:hypothetical protein
MASFLNQGHDAFVNAILPRIVEILTVHSLFAMLQMDDSRRQCDFHVIHGGFHLQVQDWHTLQWPCWLTLKTEISLDRKSSTFTWTIHFLPKIIIQALSRIRVQNIPNFR